MLDPAGGRKTLTRTVYGTPFQIAFYRPRIEGLFSRIERWTATDTGISHWRTISRDNVTTLYGADPASRIADPADPSQDLLLADLPELGRQGQRRESTATPPKTAPESTRPRRTRRTGPPQTRAAQIYLKTVQLRERPALLPRLDGARGDRRSRPTGCSRVVLDYGDHASVPPTPQRRPAVAAAPRPVLHLSRPDSRSGPTGGSSGCCSSTTSPTSRRPGLTAWSDRSISVYSDQQAPADPRNPVYTFLVSVTQTGYRPGRPRVWSPRSMPPLEFELQPAADPAGGPDPGPGQPGQPAGRAGRQPLPLGRSGRRGPVGHPQRRRAAPGTTSATSAPPT